MGLTRMGPPTEMILMLKNRYGILNFVETGTYLGDTILWASQNFAHASTIEYSTSLHQQAVEKYGHIKNIAFLYGDTREKLIEVVAKLDVPTFFWLDAHWSGGQTYGKSDECPLIEEIEIINRSEHENFIFIDDARLFLSPPPAPHVFSLWPDITAVINTINASDSKRYIVIFQDVIIVAPQSARSLIAAYCQEANGKSWSDYSIQNSGLRSPVKMIKKLLSVWR
jgi:hypothetical protein